MSGIYIPGMEMPKACVYRENGHLITCPLYDIDGYCGALNTEASHRENGKLSDCPLIPVHDHGRLIDADAEVARVQNLYNKAVAKDKEMGCVNVYEGEIAVLKLAPTVIPAEEKVKTR